MNKNKIAQGILSLFLIIILLASILAGSIFYENYQNSADGITGRVTGLERVSGL